MTDIFDQWNSIPEGTLRGLSEVGITVHWIILSYSIGLFVLAILTEFLAYKYESEKFMKMARTYSKVAIVIFAVGSATGTLSEFGLLLFWPNFLELVGKFYFVPMYLEVFAFFAEVVLVYIYYYTWERVGRRFHLIVGVSALIGVIASAFLIMSVNTLMSYPPGILEVYDSTRGIWVEPEFLLYLPEGGSQIFSSSELRTMINSDVDRYHAILGATIEHEGVIAVVFMSPGSFINSLHVVMAAITTTVFTFIGIYSWRYMKTEEQEYYFLGIKYMSIIGSITLFLQGIIGHEVAANMAKYNPEQLSAIEGNSTGIWSFVDIPIFDSVMSWLAYGDADAKILPYESIPEGSAPPLILFYVYYSKIILASILFADVILLLYFIFRKKSIPKKLLKINLVVPIIAQLVSNFGWITREAGRKPWTIYGIQRVDEAATTVPLPTIVVVGVWLYSLGLLFGLSIMVWFLFRIQKEELVIESKESLKIEEME